MDDDEKNQGARRNWLVRSEGQLSHRWSGSWSVGGALWLLRLNFEWDLLSRCLAAGTLASNHRQSPRRTRHGGLKSCEHSYFGLLAAELSSFGQGDEERIVDVLVVGFLSSLQHLKRTPQETETSTGNRINASEMAVLQTPDAPMIRFTLHHGHLLDATMGASSIDLKTRIIGLNKPRRSLRASSKWLQVQGSTVQPALYWRKCGYARVAGTFRWEPARMQEPS